MIDTTETVFNHSNHGDLLGCCVGGLLSGNFPATQALSQTPRLVELEVKSSSAVAKVLPLSLDHI